MNRWRTILAGLAVATFVAHLVFGVYYVTRSDTLDEKPTLAARGEDFLKVFPGWGWANEGDSAAYNRAAIETLRTGVPRTNSGAVFFHAPLYAYFLAACYWLGGIRLLSVAVPQALLAALICWFTGLAAARLVRSRPGLAAVLAGGLILINLRLAMYTAYISPTMLAGCLGVVALEAISDQLTPGRLARFCIAIILGCFTQAVFFVVGMAAGLWLVLEFARRRQRACLIGAGALALAALAKPGMTVLGLAGGQTDPLAKGARYTLWEANNPYYESMTWTSRWERRPANPWTQWRASVTEQERHEKYLRRAEQSGAHPGILWIRENPGTYTRLCWIRMRTGVGPYTGQMSPRNRLISTVWWLLVFPAAFIGLWKMRAQPAAHFTILAFAALAGFGAVVIVEWYLRYRIPVDLMLTAFAAVGYTEGRRRHAPPERA